MAHSDKRVDQASGLRQHMQNPAPVQVIAITSGKGGVGKTNISTNLSIAMADIGKRVMLMDADMGLANVDVLLGLRATRNLSHVMEGHCSLEEIILNGPSGVKVIPGASGITRMAELSARENAGLIHAFSELGSNIDVLIIDTAAGISDSVMRFSVASHEILVVVCDEPASITDAYALIKVLNRDHGQKNFRILANMVENGAEGRSLFNKLRRVTEQFLDISLEYFGMIPFDDSLRKAVQRQNSVVKAFPRSRSAQAFKKLALAADKWSVPKRARGHLEFFIDRLVQGEQQEVETFL